MNELTPTSENEEVVVEAEVLETKEQLEAKAQILKEEYGERMKKYRLSLVLFGVALVAYFVSLLLIRNHVLVLICCIPIFGVGFWNNRIGKTMREMSTEYNKIMQKISALEKADNEFPQNEETTVSSDSVGSAIVANATSLNDLPKEYTVLDQEELDGQNIAHIILSPYGVTLVDEQDHRPAMEAILNELNIQAPIFWQQPQEDIAALAETIQVPKQVALNEQEIYKILYRLRGIN